jgi:ribosomal protein S18 acetylase RimI-like enzyme
MIKMDIECYAAEPPGAVVDGCVNVYAAAFGQPPYAESVDEAELLRERIARYARRDGFRLPVAAGPRPAAASTAQIAGFALAVRAHPGDWWRDQVAGVIGTELAARWLPPGVLEVVHVAVDPACQRQGIGRRLLASVLTNPGTSTAVLSCDASALPAQQLYLSQGWQLVTAELAFQPGMQPRWLMGIDLNL